MRHEFSLMLFNALAHKVCQFIIYDVCQEFEDEIDHEKRTIISDISSIALFIYNFNDIFLSFFRSIHF